MCTSPSLPDEKEDDVSDPNAWTQRKSPIPNLDEATNRRIPPAPHHTRDKRTEDKVTPILEIVYTHLVCPVAMGFHEEHEPQRDPGRAGHGDYW